MSTVKIHPASSRRQGRKRRQSPVPAAGYHGLPVRKLSVLCFAACLSAPWVFHDALAELPVPCGGGGCAGNGGPATWVTFGQVQAPTVSGHTLNIRQESERAILNWQSFNIGRDDQVVFQQPDSAAVALNRIFQGDPSRILGTLSANGQVYLVNRNGILFGKDAQVNVHGLIASTLNMSDRVFRELGLAKAINNDGGALPAFQGGSAADAAITIETGARIETDNGGRVLIIAPEVVNAGAIHTPDGQTILAGAKDEVFLAVANDPDLRGLLVGVKTGGNVANLGSIIAERGNISLLGLAVNQQGLTRATTSVSLNGTIHLTAADHANTRTAGGVNVPESTRGGALVLGANSVTEVLPELGSEETAIDAQAQPVSQVILKGARIELKPQARVSAPAGRVTLIAKEATNALLTVTTPDSALSQVIIADGARIDVSGNDSTVLPASRNIVPVDARGNELRDAPLQREGPLRGETVYVDRRQGTKLLDISGALAKLARKVGERTTNGGQVIIRSQGGVDIKAGATIDVSGGQVRYRGGSIAVTQLISNDKVVAISDADPNIAYEGLLTGLDVNHTKWGVTESFVMPGAVRFEPGYVEGKDGGSLSIDARSLKFSGQFRAATVIGPFQRKGPAAVLSAPFARAFDEQPLGGGLAIFLNSVGAGRTPELRLGVDGEAASATNSATFHFDDRWVSASGLGRLDLGTAGRLRSDPDTRLVLPAFGTLSLKGAVVDLHGRLAAPGGRLTITAKPVSSGDGSLSIGADTRLDVSGVWLNEGRLTGDSLFAPLALDGGAINLATQGDLILAPGSILAADGGARLTGTGRLEAGQGGSIELSQKLEDSILRLDGRLQAYGLFQGGGLTLQGNGFLIGATEAAIGAHVTRLSPDFFSKGGFSRYSLSASQDGIHIEEQARIRLRQKNYRLDPGFNQRPGGGGLAAFSTIGTLADFQRSAVQLSLDSRRKFEPLDLPAEISLGKGAAIEADPGARLSFTSDTSLFIDGGIKAPGGDIRLKVETNEQGFDPRQMIWLGPQALLSAPAVARLRPNDLGLRRGEMLNAGRVSLVAKQGSIIAAPGSAINVDGKAANFDLADRLGGGFESRPVAGRAGKISAQAAETLVLGGSLSGRPAPLYGAAGGEIALTLDPRQRPVQDNPTADTRFPTTDRIAQFGFVDPARQASLSQLQPGEAVPAPLNGRLIVPQEAIVAGGFDALDLTVRPTGTGTNVTSGAEIRFNSDLSLSLRQRLSLDAPLLRNGSADQVRLEAAYVALGQASSEYRLARAVPTAGAGRLLVKGRLIDLINETVISGFGSAADSGEAAVSLVSQGDLRLRGVKLPGSTATTVSGGLYLDGDLRLAAAQVYPTTLSDFEIALEGVQGQRIRVEAMGVPRAGALSAGGHLVFKAPLIEQAGLLRAPFGRIDLLAGERVTLAPGSITSVSGNGLRVPFGQLQFGRDLIFPLRNNLSRVVSQLPEKRIAVDAPQIDIRPDAVIDVSGGGNLQAFEFIPGPGGSRDVLQAGASGGSFAILPRSGLEFAPYDPVEFLQSGLAVGARIQLAGGGGVPAGEYAVLPARYALFGGYLVSPVALSQALAPGEVLTRPDGVSVVAGRRGVAGTAIRDSLWSAFAVESPAQVRRRAEYVKTDPGKLFAGGGGEVPGDDGTLSIRAGADLSLAGRLARGHGGGRGSRVDITAARIAVVNERSDVDGEVELLAAELNAFGADSLLLGGTRIAGAAGTLLQIGSKTLSIAKDVQLEQPELLLTAAEELTVGTGVVLTARGDAQVADTPLRLVQETRPGQYADSDGALLRLSVGNNVAPAARSASAGSKGDLLVAADTRLTAAGSITLDATGDLSLKGELSTAGGLFLSAPSVSLGEVPSGVAPKGLLLSADLLSRLQGSDLTLRGHGDIALGAAIDLAFGRLVLDAPRLQRLVGVDDAAVLRAAHISLANSSGSSATAPVPTTAGGTLQLIAKDISLAGGTMTLDDFSGVTLRASHALLMDRDGGLVAAGDLALQAPLLTTGDGVSARVRAAGTLNVSMPEGAPPAGESAAPGLAGTLVLTADSLRVGSRIRMPAGRLSLIAARDLNLAEGAMLDVSGIDQVFADKTVATPGGTLSLSAGANLSLNDGVRLDVSGAPGGGEAGNLILKAPDGVLSLSGDVRVFGGDKETVASGSLDLDVGRVTDFNAFTRVLNAGGFRERRRIRLHEGDLTIASGETLRARELALTLDQGSITVAGVIDATAPDGGRVALNARDDIRLTAGAFIDARSTDAPEGGRVSLAVRRGETQLQAGSIIDVGGVGTDGSRSATGRLRLSVRQDALAGPLRVGTLDGEVRGAEAVEVESILPYDVSASGVIDDRFLATVQSDLAALVPRQAAAAAVLGITGDSRFRMVPGVEVVSDGDLHVAVSAETRLNEGLPAPFSRSWKGWNLVDWRPGGEPGVLTLRAAGDLVLDSSLSDGFRVQAIPPVDPSIPVLEKERLIDARSWSFNLVAGADTASADRLATAPVARSLALKPGAFVRTGTGDINIVSSGGISLGDSRSVIYTAGRDGGVGDIANANPQAGLFLEFLLGGTGSPANLAESVQFPVAGGDLSIRSGGDFKGVPVDQLISGWQARIGGNSGRFGTIPTYWGIRFDRFHQGVGALGGGDVAAEIGGDLENVSFSIPTTGKAKGDVKLLLGGGLLQFQSGGDVVTEVNGGGQLDLNVGGDVRGGSYYIGRGNAGIRAGGDFGFAPDAALGPFLALGDGTIAVTAGGDVDIETVFSPTVLMIPRADRPLGSDENASFFFTYSDDSATLITSLGGGVTLHNNLLNRGVDLEPLLNIPLAGNARSALDIYPGTLQVRSLRGGIDMLGPVTLFPTPRGRLELLAEGDIITLDRNNLLIQSDADPVFVPTPLRPWTLQAIKDKGLFNNTFGRRSHAAVPLHRGDEGSNLIVSKQGTIGPAQLYLTKQARIYAGRDLNTLTLEIQHANESDVSLLQAGRDIVQPLNRLASGQFNFLPEEQFLRVTGPGRLDVIAGRDIDLGTSPGIESLGNILNPALAGRGADINVLAGIRAAPAYSDFASRYLTNRDGTLSTLSPIQQRQLLLARFFAELKASGIAAMGGNNDFFRGFDAIDTLFPGDAFSGDLSLILSQITTRDGGDINILVPGGMIDGGVASTAQLGKSPEDLGIVALQQGDVNVFVRDDILVNQSRVFALDGDLLIWSSQGNIDAGRGAKTALSVRRPSITTDVDGNIVVNFPPAVAGSGLLGRNAFLFAPQGVVDAGDAGISVREDLTIAAVGVLGADNIDVGGVAVGVPVATTGGLAAGLTGVSNLSSGIANGAEKSLSADVGSAADRSSATPLADAAFAVLDVLVLDFENSLGP